MRATYQRSVAIAAVLKAVEESGASCDTARVVGVCYGVYEQLW